MNDKYDEAVDVSQSMDQGMKMEEEKKGTDGGVSPSRGPNMSALPEEKTNSFMNKPFDEALEFSQSNSDESVDTRGGDHKAAPRMDAKSNAGPMSSSTASSGNYSQPKTQQVAVCFVVLCDF